MSFFFFGADVPFHTLTQIKIVDNHEHQQIKDVREEWIHFSETHRIWGGDFKIFNARGTHSWQNVFLIFLQAVSLGTFT